MQRAELVNLSREELVARAERLGVTRPRALTQPELVDEIISRTAKSDRERARARGWLGRARDLIAGVVEKGLHLPEVARVLRATPAPDGAFPMPPAPLPTVTLAEIYAAQGHFDRALSVLDDVLSREPEHAEARRLHERFTEQARTGRRRTTPPPPAAPERAVDEVAVVETALDASASLELPARYDVDEVVAIAVDPSTIYVYWEVKPTTMARARARRPAGSLTVRVVSVVATWDGPTTSTRDLRVDPLYGDVFFKELPAGAHVRVSVGWLGEPMPGEPDFEPFAVGVELSAPRAIPSPAEARDVARWVPGFARGAAPPPPAPWRPGTPASSAAVAAAVERMQQRLVDAATGRPTGVLGAPAPGTAGGRPVAPHIEGEVHHTTTVRRGGASDLVREWSSSRSGHGDLGGASDLIRGGASDLHRR